MYEVRSSQIAGVGIFATEFIPKGTKIVEYTGRFIRNEDLEQLRPSLEELQPTYYLTVEGGVLDGLDGGSGAERANHSCDNNSDFDGVWIVAQRDIHPGEEITVDYELGEMLPGIGTERTKCNCGSSKCRGTMDWIPEDEWQAMHAESDDL